MINVMIFATKGVRFCVLLSYDGDLRPLVASDSSYIDLIGPVIAAQKLKSSDREFVARRIDEQFGSQNNDSGKFINRILGSVEDRYFYVETTAEYPIDKTSSAEKNSSLIFVFEISNVGSINSSFLRNARSSIIRGSHDIMYDIAKNNNNSLMNSIAEIINPLNMGLIRSKRKSRIAKAYAFLILFYSFLLLLGLSVFIGRLN